MYQAPFCCRGYGINKMTKNQLLRELKFHCMDSLETRMIQSPPVEEKVKGIELQLWP